MADSDSPTGQPSSHKQKGSRGVEQGTEMSPQEQAAQGGSTRAEEEYLYKRYEHYGSEYFEDVAEEEDIYGDRAQFLAIEYELTPK